MAGKLFKNRILQHSNVGISNHPGVEKHSSGHGLNDSKLNFSIFGPESENREKNPKGTAAAPGYSLSLHYWCFEKCGSLS